MAAIAVDEVSGDDLWSHSMICIAKGITMSDVHDAQRQALISIGAYLGGEQPRKVDSLRDVRELETAACSALQHLKHPTAQYVDLMIGSLNSAYAADRAAIWALQSFRIPCSWALANHPDVMVDHIRAMPGQDCREQPLEDCNWSVGFLGVLNGCLLACGMPMIAAQWSEPNDRGDRKLLGFTRYTGPDPVQACDVPPRGDLPDAEAVVPAAHAASECDDVP
jgi:hypothetical protein